MPHESNKMGMDSVVPIAGGQAQNGGSMPSPIAEVHWTCVCGTKVKAIVDMDKAGVNVPCPNSPCKVTRTPPGQITRIWVETGLGVWKEVDLDRLISPAD